MKPAPREVTPNMPKSNPVGELFRYNFNSGSNVLPFSMMGKLALGGYVGSDVTQDVESKLRGNNRAGLYQQLSLVVYPLRSRFDGGALRTSSTAQFSVSPKKVSLNAISVRDVQSVGALTLDRQRRCFMISGEELSLPSREFQVLWELMSPVGRVVSKSDLADKLSDLDDLLAPNALEAFISRLRKKLAGSGVGIRTLRGLGYSLVREGE
ncbi:MAG: DNA-binding response regulator [Oxalobacteraceae bacterium]|nr:DNA-binding response regulator [Oxalobacteraceae bacterium]